MNGLKRPVCGRRVHALIGPLVLASFLVGSSPAWAQYTALSMPYQTPEPNPGDLVAHPMCTAYAWADDPSYYLSVTAVLMSHGQVLGEGTQWGLGNAYVDVQGTVSIGRSTDRVVDCYLSSSFGASQELHHTYPRRTPESVTNELDIFMYSGLGNYERLRWYAVDDNYGYRYGYSGTAVNESYTMGDNGCNLTIVSENGQLNSDAMFEDRYTTYGTPIPACSVAPSCVSRSTQTYDIDSRRFSHPVTWSCTNVEVGR